MSTNTTSTPSRLASALQVTFVALGATALVLIIIYVLALLIDLLGSRVDYMFDKDTGHSCYLYRSSISCVQGKREASNLKPQKPFMAPIDDAQG